MNTLTALPTVEFRLIAPAGFRILAALSYVVRRLQTDLVITSGTDGEHSGPLDPHHFGNAYDVRSHDFSEPRKTLFLTVVMRALCDSEDEQILPRDGGFVTDKFFGWIEHAGAPDEHYHFQLRKGMVYG